MRLDAKACHKRLTESRFAVLGTVDPNRGTHLVPVVFAVFENRLAIPLDTVKPKSGARLRRVTNLETDPRSTLLVDHRSEEWTALWWVRADLIFEGTEGYAGEWQELLASRYAQYEAPGAVEEVLIFGIQSLTGWAASDT